MPQLAKRAQEDARAPDSVAARSAVATMLIAFAFFLVFESEGLRHFTRDLPGDAVTEVMANAADR